MIAAVRCPMMISDDWWALPTNANIDRGGGVLRRKCRWRRVGSQESGQQNPAENGISTKKKFLRVHFTCACCIWNVLLCGEWRGKAGAWID
jgi:hypothetical protein